MTKQNLSFNHILKILRPHQWVKNILVFTPMLLSHNIDIYNFILSIKAFIIFSLTASSIYIINDIIDVKSDKNHPFKKYRPYAAGLISTNQCNVLVLILLSFCTLLLISTNKEFFFLVFFYFIISNLYTFFFKKIIIIDLLILSVLYTSRILGGGFITDIYVSNWLLSFSIFFFISLASVKRLIEIVNTKRIKKKFLLGRGYSIKNRKIIYKIANITSWISILILIFYINSSQVTQLYAVPNILWIVCAVMFFWITRIIYISHKGKIKDDPIAFAITDIISYLCLFIILFIFWLGNTILIL